MRTLGDFFRNQQGSTMVEFTLVALFFLVLTFGVIEFSFALWQWNSATKAVQLGARLAAVSDPLWQDLPSITDSGTPGDPWTTNYDVTCQASGGGGSCTGTSPGGFTYDAGAMTRLVYGRNAGSPPTCGTVGADGFPGMCDIFSRIAPANVSVEYAFTGLGFSGRPGGPVPTVTVRIRDLTFDFITLNTLLGFGPIAMPEFKVTMTGEDLNAAQP
jgi:hypothetical protein